MAVWLARARRRGEQQEFALDHGIAVVGWDEMPDLSPSETREEMEAVCRQSYPNAKPRTITNWLSQLWAFAKRIQAGDLVVLPLKGQNSVAIGRANGDYKYEPRNPAGTKHTRPVEWIAQDMPRDRFDEDLLFSLGAFMTVCQIKRNNAEKRIRAMLEGGTQPVTPPPDSGDGNSDPTDTVAPPDMEEYSTTQIRTFISQKFASHHFSDLVNAILEAQGYKTEVSPPGPDGGVDVIAGRGPMGFDPPRLCVQVKSGSQQQDVKILRELNGVMKDFGADQGLLVSWGGFKRSVLAEARRRYFEIRLWDAGDVVDAVLRHYDQFPEDLKAELPLKRIWTLVQED